MRIPTGWTTAAAGGYGNLTRLTHDRCGRHTNVDVVLDERNARNFIATHECDDLREEREAREEREQQDNAARAATDTKLAEVVAQMGELADKLAKVAAPAPVRLLVLDATTPDTLNTTVDALTSDDFLALAAAVDTAHHRQHQRDALTHIREVLADEAPAGLSVVGVLFTAEEYHSSYYFGTTGTVLFGDGRIIVLEFEDAEETLRELYEDVDPDATLAVDLRTDTFDVDYRKSSAKTIHARFGLDEPEPSHDHTILTIVRDTLNGDYEEYDDLDNKDAKPVGVLFRSRREDDGYYLSSDDGLVLFDDGSNAIVTFHPVAAVFAKAVGCVGDSYSLIVDLRGEGTITRDVNDTTPLATRFDIP